MSGSSVCKDCGATIPNGVRGRYKDPLCATCREKWSHVFKNPARPKTYYRWECGCETGTYLDTTVKVDGKKRSVRCCPLHRGQRLKEKRAVCPVCGRSEIVAPKSNQWVRCKQCQKFVDITKRREWSSRNSKHYRHTEPPKRQEAQRVPEMWRDFSPFGPIPWFYLVPAAVDDITETRR